jgi:hypothetical protein
MFRVVRLQQIPSVILKLLKEHDITLLSPISLRSSEGKLHKARPYHFPTSAGFDVNAPYKKVADVRIRRLYM